MLPNNSCPYDPPIKPGWWRDDQFWNLHRNNIHNIENYCKCKDFVQALVNSGKAFTDGLTKNYDHQTFKQPLPNYQKGESSQAQKKNHDAKINYTYAYMDNVINMLEPIEYVYILGPKFDWGFNYNTDD